MKSVQLLKKRPDEMKNLIRNLVQGGDSHVHSENLPTSLLTSADEDDRKFAVDKILTMTIVQYQESMEVRYQKLNSEDLKNYKTKNHFPILPFPCIHSHVKEPCRSYRQHKKSHGEVRHDAFVRASIGYSIKKSPQYFNKENTFWQLY